MPRQKDRLDRAAIVGTALDLLDEVGIDALSTRALAARLGVKSPALYWHFENKQQLVAAMAVEMLTRAPWPEPPRTSGDADAWIVARARAFRQALLSRRDGARVHAGSRPTAEHLRWIEAQVAGLCVVGLPAVDAARAVLAVSRYTVGWVLEEQSDHGYGEPWNLQDLPALAAAAEVFEQRDPDRDFDHGLRALVRGLTLSA